MNTRITCTILAVLMVSNVVAFDNIFRIEKCKHGPDFVKLQYAGNIGHLSFGFGYDFFNSHLKTSLLYGRVPSSISQAKDINIITLKNSFTFLHFPVKSVTLSPLIGFTASYETGNNSFLKLADKYPEDYYGTNAFHFTLYVGANAYKSFKKSKSIEGIDLYFELGTVDTYLWYAILSDEITPAHIYSAAIGLNLHVK
jgi:hypothetical protein